MSIHDVETDTNAKETAEVIWEAVDLLLLELLTKSVKRLCLFAAKLQNLITERHRFCRL